MQKHSGFQEGNDVPRRAYSYRRISAIRQRNGDGLLRQKDFAQALCEKHGWTLDDTLVFEDRGRSGFHGHHRRGKGQLLAFMEMVKRKRIMSGSVLIIENLDRLTREEMDEAHDLFKSILKAGIWIATEMPERIYTPESLKTLLGTIEPLLHMYVAHEQSAKLSERIADKWERWRECAGKGIPILGNRCPSWIKFSKDRKQYVLIPQRERTIKMIFQLCGNGLGIHRIASWLNRRFEEFPSFTEGKDWSFTAVHHLLFNRCVLGELQLKKRLPEGKKIAVGDPLLGYYPSIISEEQWRLSHAAISRRRRKSGRPGGAETNLFTGMVFAANSRNTMSIQRLKSYTGEAWRYLSDLRIDKEGNYGRRIAYQPFEDAVLRSLEQLRAADVLPPGVDQSEREIRIGELTKRQVALDHRMEEIQRSIEEPDSAELVASLTASWKKLRIERQRLKRN